MPALDGLRGFAVILVMLHHFGLFGRMGEEVFIDAQVKNLLRSGWAGVDLFFVLSGFLITGILLDAKGGNNYFRNFYARRFLRIFPIYYVFLFLYLVVLPRIYPLGPAFGMLLSDQVWYWTYLVNFKIGFEYWPAYGAIGHFWSLALEEQFYLIWPLLVFFLSRRSLSVMCCLLIIFSPFVRIALTWIELDTGAYVLTPARMDTLALGGLISIAVRSEKGKSFLSRWTFQTFCYSGLIIAVLFFWHGHLDLTRSSVLSLGLTALVFFFGALLILAITIPSEHFLGRIFNSNTLKFFGKYSYALYIFHHPVAFYLSGKLAFKIPSLPTLLGSQLSGLLLYSIVATTLSLFLAMLSWYLLESRFLTLKRFFAYDSN